MESHLAKSELRELDRVRAAVAKESYKMPRWAIPSMLAGLVVFLGSLRLLPWTTHDVRGVVWVAFVLTWVHFLNRSKRVIAGRIHGRAETLRNYVLGAVWIALLVVVQITIGSNISWGWATVFIVVTASATGVSIGWLQHRSSR